MKNQKMMTNRGRRTTDFLVLATKMKRLRRGRWTARAKEETDGEEETDDKKEMEQN